MPYDAPDLAGLSLAEIADMAARRKLPPVAIWSPEKTGDSEMRIATDGKWYHQGGIISRPSMVRAFSSLLRRDPDGRYWLVTPQEKLCITVDDVPFIAVEVRSEQCGKDRRLAFRLNTDDLVIAGPSNAIEMRREIPYLHVRDKLWAKCARPVYYELAEMALSAKDGKPGVWSDGAFFPVGESA